MASSGAQLTTAEVTPLPERIVVGRGAALFCDGRCRHPHGELDALEVAIGGHRAPAAGFGFAPPRMRGTDYWWAIVPIPPLAEESEAEVRLHGRTRGGRPAGAVLGTVRLLPGLEPPAVEMPREIEIEGPLVAICMATYEPEIELFRAQIESIRAQTHRRWVCLISDDGSGERGRGEIREAIADDPRFVVSEAPANRGFYANFERSMSMVPPGADYVALSDQDDRWREDKIERLLAGLAPGARLVYSDMRIVDRGGAEIADTYWRYRRNNHTDFGSLVLANTVTGAASLFETSLLDDVLPLPPRQSRGAFHDHWIAQVALALGSISYVDEPLYDYVQHDAASLGFLQAHGFGRYSAPLRERAGIWYRRWRGRGFRLGWRVPYFRLYCRVRQMTTVLRMRCGDRMAPDRLRVLDSIDEGPSGIAWLARRAVRDLGGPTETIGRERVMLAGIAWHWGARLRRRLRLHARRAR